MLIRRGATAWASSGAALGALSASRLDLAPTGVGWWDNALSAIFVIGAVMAAARVGNRRFAPALAVVAAFCSEPFLAVVAAVGLIIVVLADLHRVPFRSEWFGVVAGIGLLQLQSVGPFGTPSLIVAVVAAPVAAGLVSGRHWWHLAPLPMTLVAISAGGASAGWQSADELAALPALTTTPEAMTAEHLDSSEAAFERAVGRLDSWWARPGRYVPILAQHLSVLHTASEAGLELTGSAESALSLVELDSSSSTPDDAALVDLSGLEASAGVLAGTATRVDRARVDLTDGASGWLVPAADRERRRALEVLDEAADDVALANLVAAEVPGLLGRHETQRYLVLFTNPAEARELGGIVGYFLELEVLDGQLSIVDGGRDVDLNAAGPGEPLDPTAFPPRLLANRPERFAQNWTSATDVSTVARTVGLLAPSFDRGPVDGVITIDPFALGALLGVTGPIDVEIPTSSGPGTTTLTLTESTVPDFLLSGQYERFSDNERRSAALAAVVDGVFDELTVHPPHPLDLASQLAPVVKEGRLQMATGDGNASMLLTELGLNRPHHRAAGQDHLAVVHTNAGGNKLDTYLHRSVRYSARLDAETGELAATVRVDLTNTAPPSGLPPYVAGRTERNGLEPGVNRVQLSLFTPHVLESITPAMPVGHDVTRADGLHRWMVEVDVQPGETVELHFELVGMVDPAGPYRLTLRPQPLVSPDSVEVTVIGGDQSWIETELELREDVTLETGPDTGVSRERGSGDR